MGDNNNGRHAKPRRRHGIVIAGLVVLLVATAILVTRMEACADAPRPDTKETGRAAFYQDWTHGNCSLDVRSDLVVSVSTEEYADSAACGGYLDVTGPRGTVRVQVVDRCPGCRRGDLDLSRTAFARIAAEGQGVAQIAYHLVRNPKMDRPLSFRVKQGSTSFWMGVQVIDHGNPLSGVSVEQEGAWQPLTRSWDNYWVAGGLGAGPFTVRVLDVYGNSAVAHGIRLRPGETQRTSHRLYATSAASTPEPMATPVPVPAPTWQRAPGVTDRCA
ncbi:hypothetical protein J5X84_06175 [Streptosporangiaceae bacterium NEAU-GS5]|nr:hypothetical protein [Streptosporangiaceae bacterium NEAU-GS5]